MACSDEEVVVRLIIGGVFQSLDGVMQAPGRPEEDRAGAFDLGGWVGAFTDAQTRDAVFAYLLGAPYALLLGRKTYDIFAAYWPFMPADNAIAARFNATTKYVLTHSDTPLAWANSHRLTSIDAIAHVKATAGPDLLIQGSSTLYPPLFRAGLIDRLHLQTFPIVLGHGKRLFGAGTPAGGMRLVHSTVSSTGVVIATYEPTGQLPTISPEPPNPSDAEIARRERVKREG
ncbi:dihydrofolate reductase [Candidatus Chloroploca sp. M-50]|uniref:Dihydrofolate reductase n=1 Tax=Candidatus Chloroploca mongolica TaxID=2528176 RepID=A0ABS4DAK6_9CHLR|nr:dihydrofolate reductase [Candidatus Chloroploca mongolica]